MSTAHETRTSIVIDQKLMREAMKRGGFKTKREALNAALTHFVRLKRQRDILDLVGKVEWTGDLDEIRQSRFPDWIEGKQRIAPESLAVLGRGKRLRKRVSR